MFADPLAHGTRAVLSPKPWRAKALVALRLHKRRPTGFTQLDVTMVNHISQQPIHRLDKGAESKGGSLRPIHLLG
jgi:hypothetical protein